MELAPFDLSATGSRPIAPIPPDLERVYFADVKVNKVYYIKLFFDPHYSIWLLAEVTAKGDRVVFDSSWSFLPTGVWTPFVNRDVTPAQIDTDITAESGGHRYHFYAPKAAPLPAPLPARNLPPKPAPSGLSQRKTRRNNSRSRRTNRSRRTRRK